MTTGIQVPPTAPVLPSSPANTMEPPGDIVTTINLHLQGTLEQLQQASPTASSPVFQHSMPRRQLPSVALGVPPSTRETEDPFRLEGMDSAIPAPMASLIQTSMQAAMLGDTPSFTHVTHCSSPPCKGHQRWQACACFPPALCQSDWQISYFLYRRK